MPPSDRSKTRRRKPALPRPIAMIVFDFDGVFTDNKVHVDETGRETVVCDRRDGLGIGLLRERGIPMLILSKEKNPVVAARGRKLGIEVAAGCDDKAAYLRDRLARDGIDAARVVYVGNDINDLEAMATVGFSAAPADSHPAVLKRAGMVLRARGGAGAVRELCEIILKEPRT